MKYTIILAALTTLFGVITMPGKRRVSPDLDVFTEGNDPGIPRGQGVGGPQRRTSAGSQTEFTKGDTNPQNVMNVYIGGDSAVTVLFGIPSSAPFLAPNDHSPTPRANALISWLANGIQVNRLISVTSGEQITGVGEYVSIQVTDVTTPDARDPSPNYVVSCIVAPGTRGSANTLPSYFPPNSTTIVPPSNDVAYPIPQDVGMKTVSVITTSPTDTQLEFVDYAGNILIEIPAADIGPGPFEIPIGAQQMNVVNTNVSTPYQISVVFGVSG